MKKIILLIFLFASLFSFSQEAIRPIKTVGATDTTSLNLRINAKEDTSNFVFLNSNVGVIYNGVRPTFTTGDYNTFIGRQSAESLTSGSYNVFKGFRAGRLNTTGSNNTNIGAYSGHNNLTGTQNTYLGMQAGFGSVSVSNNTGIGYKSLYASKLGSLTFVGLNSASSVLYPYASAGLGTNVFQNTDSIMYATGVGHVVGQNAELVDRTVAVGYASINNQNAVQYVTALGHEACLGRIADSSYIYHVVSIGEYNYRFANDVYNSVGIGNSVRGNDTLASNNNVLIGHKVDEYGTGNFNTIIGSKAGNAVKAAWSSSFGAKYTANKRILIGNLAGASMADTIDNLFVIATDSTSAYELMRGDINGTANTLIINGTLQSDQILFPTSKSTTLGVIAGGDEKTTSGQNTNIGYQAGGSTGANAIAGKYYNNFFGYGAGRANYGNDNIFFGRLAGAQNTSGDYNTFIGNQSAYQNITGSGNVFIGYNAGNQETGSNLLYICNSNTTTPLIYGDFSTSDLTIYGTLIKPTGTIVDNDATPSVATRNVWTYNGTANSVTITNLDDAKIGAEYTIIGNSDTYTVTIQDSGNFHLNGSGIDVTLGQYDNLTVRCIGANTFIQITPLNDN